MLSGNILTFLIIYAGKTKACHPQDITFPPGFCVTQNPSHWSNEDETIRLIRQVVNPYIITKWAELKLPATQKGLVVWNVF